LGLQLLDLTGGGEQRIRGISQLGQRLSVFAQGGELGQRLGLFAELGLGFRQLSGLIFDLAPSRGQSLSLLSDG